MKDDYYYFINNTGLFAIAMKHIGDLEHLRNISTIWLDVHQHLCKKQWNICNMIICGSTWFWSFVEVVAIGLVWLPVIAIVESRKNSTTDWQFSYTCHPQTKPMLNNFFLYAAKNFPFLYIFVSIFEPLLFHYFSLNFESWVLSYLYLSVNFVCDRPQAASSVTYMFLNLSFEKHFVFCWHIKSKNCTYTYKKYSYHMHIKN